MNPNVAIVGRPNVGKSTLFNRIIGERVAITEDEPGITRDRLYREADWAGRAFNLIDTGGLELKSSDIFLNHIREQVETAIDMSDVILFVVDGKNGIHPVDEDIALALRKSKKKVVLAVNKIDSNDKMDHLYEFYSLGFDEVIAVSAEGALGIGDLLDAIVADLPKIEERDEDPALRVAVIGKPNVGKSSLVNLLVGENRMIVTDISGTTRDAIDSTVVYQGREYVFVDTAGLRRKRAVEDGVERYSVIRTLNAIDRSDICLLMIDATEGVTEQDTKIAGYAHEQRKALIIAVNKWDAIEKDTNTMNQFKEDIRNKLSFVLYAPLIFISVKEGQRIHQIFEMINMVDNNYSLRIPTGVLNEVLADAVLRNPPPSDKGVRLKIFYMAQVGARPPVFVLHINRRDLVHFSYVRYLENRLRERFGFIGTPLVFKFKVRGSQNE